MLSLMDNGKKYHALRQSVEGDPELQRCNGVLDRLEQIEKIVGGLICEIDQMRMERERALIRKSGDKEKI